MPLWRPLTGPQTLAQESPADELLYGGAAGGGKSDFLIGQAITRHRKAAIFRREYRQLADIVQRGKDLIEDSAGFNGTALVWRFPGGRTLELGASEHEDDVRKWRGRPHDFKGFDELSEFTENQYLFLSGWARTTVPHQRVRIVGASNPPATAEGEWMIVRWAPWLDEQHPNPAAPGELRWFARLDGKDTELESGAPFEYKGETIYPKSRTFIPASLKDNPYLSADSSYRATLQALPEPLRSQLLYGDFTAGRGDDAATVIPASWVRLAQQRWSEENAGRITCVGVDVARGGRDKTVLARRSGYWFAPLEVHAGADTPDGMHVAVLIGRALAQGGYANVDVIGIGSSAYDSAVQRQLRVWPVNVAASAKDAAGHPLTDRSGRLMFANIRAAAFWSLREALDPSSDGQVALPPSRTLLADLTSPLWEMRGGRIFVESKDHIRERLGRSPDEGDAVALAWWTDPMMAFGPSKARRRELVIG